ncbi:hypothetical protein [Gallaecimonas mangrovi]|uniref:hypothetical protein n=1 Tax=Gallaecimonas mangrovi TaxID=2291597 RepID=UPI000E1FC030|nr:hypothetical protein [Gallaecimonas mangrovi]
MDDRQENLQKVTKKLVVFTAGILSLVIGYLIVLAAICPQAQCQGHEKPIVLPFVLSFGLIGGFVSIQQRLPKIASNELRMLSRSWVSITLIPINGAIFSVVLMLMFISGIIQGELFPRYEARDIYSLSDVYSWIKEGLPKTSTDLAKLFFWSFVSGFSERLVPQVIRATTRQVHAEQGDDEKDKEDKPAP